jgi:hypothetical protein
MLLLRICSYLKSVLRYILSILDNCYVDTLPSKYVGRICSYFSKPKGVREQNGLGITAVQYSSCWCFQSSSLQAFGFATVASVNCVAYMLMAVALNSDARSSLKEQMTN